MAVLEVCVDSTASALAAKQGGADRIELCASLVTGGITPSPALFWQVRQETGMPVRPLLRPRFGDFCYDEYEFSQMLEEAQLFAEVGADAIVTGILLPDGRLDVKRMRKLQRAAGKTPLALHRAFDMCINPMETLEEAVALGLCTILTSGQKNSAWEGRELLAALQNAAGGRIEILAGAGISADMIDKLGPLTGISAWHMSGKESLESRMKYRKEEISMGLPGLSEYTVWQTNVENIRSAVRSVRKINDRQYNK